MSKNLFTEDNMDDLLGTIYSGETIRTMDALELNPAIDEEVNGEQAGDGRKRPRQEYSIMLNKIEFEGEEVFVVFGEGSIDDEFYDYDEELLDKSFKFSDNLEEANSFFVEFYNEWLRNWDY